MTKKRKWNFNQEMNPMKQPAHKMNAPPFRKAGWVCGLALMLSAGMGATNSAQAANLDFIYAPAIGHVAPPLVTVTLTDLGNTVKFDVFNQAGTGTKLDSLYFNFAKDALNPAQLQFTNVSAAVGTFTTVLAPTTSTQLASLRPGPDGFFDGKFEYTTNNFLGNGQTLSFELGMLDQNLNPINLDPVHFNFLSIPGPGGTPGPFLLASHLQNYLVPGTTETSAWIAAVPLPPAAVLFGAGLVALVGLGAGNWKKWNRGLA
jgi:hypothetical protein